MNKFDLINKVLMSDLQAEDKCLLIELIVRADDQWVSWPSVERLCKVRGIKHEKNFKGADHYLPGLVTKTKRGRKNVYTINTPAVAGLSDATVFVKHTAAQSNTPAGEGAYTPAVADNTPAVEGANTTSNTTKDITEAPVAAIASPDTPNYEIADDVLTLEVPDLDSSFNYLGDHAVYVVDFAGVTKTEQDRDTPALEGVSRPNRILTPGERKAFEAMVRSYRVSEENALEALRIIEAGPYAQDINEAALEALQAVGAVSQEVEAW